MNAIEKVCGQERQQQHMASVKSKYSKKSTTAFPLVDGDGVPPPPGLNDATVLAAAKARQRKGARSPSPAAGRLTAGQKKLILCKWIATSVMPASLNTTKANMVVQRRR